MWGLRASYESLVNSARGWTNDELSRPVAIVAARSFTSASQADHRCLVLANGNVGKLLRNGRAVGYLAKNCQELLFDSKNH
jgi:hypothetical protein